MFDFLFQSVTNGNVTPENFLLCTGASLLFGLAAAWVYMYRSSYTRSFAVTLVLLPAMVQTVIMLVNGNLGTGVAVMGAFGLVRFRSVPGSAREISAIFLAMALGLAAGMGCLGLGFLFLLVMGAASLLLLRAGFGEQGEAERKLKITIPEDLDYEGCFDDLFVRYTREARLLAVKTTNLGSLYELHYQIRLRGGSVPKEFLDEIRSRNGNLNISCSRVSAGRDEL